MAKVERRGILGNPYSFHRRVRKLRRFLEPLRRDVLYEMIGDPETLLVDSTLLSVLHPREVSQGSGFPTSRSLRPLTYPGAHLPSWPGFVFSPPETPGIDALYPPGGTDFLVTCHNTGPRLAVLAWCLPRDDHLKGPSPVRC